MQVRYDTTVDALYVKLAQGEYGWTDDLGNFRHVDYAKDGTVLGVEILSPRALGVDLSDVPRADQIAAELERLGFAVKQPTSS